MQLSRTSFVWRIHSIKGLRAVQYYSWITLFFSVLIFLIWRITKNCGKIKNMIGIKTISNYFLYCGLKKDEYNAIKKDAYISNFVVWRVLHIFMAGLFLFLYITSFLNHLLKTNQIFYLLAFIYSAAAISFFFILKKDSIIPQFLIYLSISLLFIFGCFISLNNPAVPATTFIALLLVTPMFMIDKPFWMTIELTAASTIFLIWMHGVKPYDIWMTDVINVTIFTIVGIFLNIIANSLRIREFVLTREINAQKDTDELTGLKNKSALTREINDFLTDSLTDKGILFVLDIDRFKVINDTYGHDVGDRVIAQLGTFLGKIFVTNEITGRFGGDEFIVFVKDTDNMDAVKTIAEEIITGASENVVLPDDKLTISVSIGIAIYSGRETNYSDLFKKADIALYKAKANSDIRYCVYE